MSSQSGVSDGRRRIDGIINKLEEIHRKIMKDETRIWLIRSLAERDLSTRDIYSFILKQAERPEACIRSTFQTEETSGNLFTWKFEREKLQYEKGDQKIEAWDSYGKKITES